LCEQSVCEQRSNLGRLLFLVNYSSFFFHKNIRIPTGRFYFFLKKKSKRACIIQSHGNSIGLSMDILTLYLKNNYKGSSRQIKTRLKRMIFTTHKGTVWVNSPLRMSLASDNIKTFSYVIDMFLPSCKLDNVIKGTIC
jgi:hypothetical protein